MLGIALGVVVIILGGKAFTPTGLPLTRNKNLTGTGAKILGVFCILLGAAFCLEGLWSALMLLSRR
jgi:hypothetical protein